MSKEETSNSFSTRLELELELRSQALEAAIRISLAVCTPGDDELTVQRAAVFLAFLQHGTVPTKTENEL